MAITVVQVYNPKTKTTLLMRFSTFIDKKEGLCNKLAIVNDKLVPISQETVYKVFDEESTFHKELRKDSARDYNLITSLSTNPEWNPEGYVKSLDGDVKTKEKLINEIKTYRPTVAWEIDHPDLYQCIMWTTSVENTEWCIDCMENLSVKQLTLSLKALKRYYEH